MNAVDRYLKRFAEPTAAWAKDIPSGYRRAVVVPCCNECETAWTRLVEPIATNHAIAMIVVNEPPEATADVRQRNQALLDRIGRERFAIRDGAARVVIDATGPNAISSRQGVGLARKLGFDLAVALWRHQQLSSPWIHSTDADATLPNTALQIDSDDAIAMLFPFWHQQSGDSQLDLATAHYELWMRYYAAGLRWAGSRWGYSALGSAFAVRADAYATAGGMPRRPAGEDFYLLSKIGKLGPIVVADTPPVMIDSRRSDRVPFGTGPGVAHRERTLATGQPPHLYDPAIFRHLREVLTALEHGHEPDHPVWITMKSSAGLRSSQRAAQSHEQRCRRALEWFDAFRTLAFVHACQRSMCPPIPWFDAIAQAPFVVSGPIFDELDPLRRRFQARPGHRFGLFA